MHVREFGGTYTDYALTDAQVPAHIRDTANNVISFASAGEIQLDWAE